MHQLFCINFEVLSWSVICRAVVKQDSRKADQSQIADDNEIKPNNREISHMDWAPRLKFKRYSHTELWTKIFRSLLNCDNSPDPELRGEDQGLHNAQQALSRTVRLWHFIIN